MRFAVWILACLMPLMLRGQDVAADTVAARVHTAQWAVPGAMIAAGATLVAVPQAREWMAREIGTHRMGAADDYVRVLPLAAYECLAFAGVECRRSFAERAIKGATATIIMGALTYGAKYAVNERRPNGERHSFPSGHTALAFMGAELMRQDYGTWWGVGAYAVATGVGVMRVIGGRHWVNDVVAGAGVGILSATAAQWLLPAERRWFAVPAYSPECKAVTLTAAIIF